MNNTAQYNNDVPAQSTAPALEELDFHPVDAFKYCPFTHALLKLGQFLTEKESTRRGITEANLSSLMCKHCHALNIRPYTAREIREQLWGESGEFRGGGVRVECVEVSPSYGRRQAHYEFSFSRILKPQNYSKSDS